MMACVTHCVPNMKATAQLRPYQALTGVTLSHPRHRSFFPPRVDVSKQLTDNPMPETIEKQQIHIVVQGPDEKSDACSVAPAHSGLHHAASSQWTMPTPSLTSSQSCASLSASHRAPSSEGTTLTNVLYSSSSTPNLSRASFKDNTQYPPEITIAASEVKRNDRGRIIPKLTGEFKKGFYVEPGQTDFDNPQGYGDWAPQIHPDGALYFFDSKRVRGDLFLVATRMTLSDMTAHIHRC
ncbi:hypothetical protein DFH29DRAFT_471521 [Suillus ampliporus]|nr:hypothetical protein DFH29DRAFT_471521 [Suillus ampliporus]